MKRIGGRVGMVRYNYNQRPGKIGGGKWENFETVIFLVKQVRFLYSIVKKLGSLSLQFFNNQ